MALPLHISSTRVAIGTNPSLMLAGNSGSLATSLTPLQLETLLGVKLLGISVGRDFRVLI